MGPDSITEEVNVSNSTCQATLAGTMNSLERRRHVHVRQSGDRHIVQNSILKWKRKHAGNVKDDILRPRSKADPSPKTEMRTSSIDQMCSKE